MRLPRRGVRDENKGLFKTMGNPNRRSYLDIVDSVRPGGRPPPAQAIPPGFPHDWSSERPIFSRPDAATAERLKQEPRYLYQQLWRNLRRTLPANANVAPEKRGARKDWSENMGSGATVGALNYPAKYTFT